MNEFRVSFFKGKFASKPSSNEIALLDTIIADKIVLINQGNIKLFVRRIGELGSVFCPATFNSGERTIHSFAQQQLFVLDFDGEISFDMIKVRAEQYGLPILFAYMVRSRSVLKRKR